ncbi:hypothetical protein Hanom_Chr15g01372931 [Helianthus anomalus]
MFTSNFRRCSFGQKFTGGVIYLSKSCTFCRLGQTWLEISVKKCHPKPVLAFTTSELVPKLSDSNITIVLIGSDTGTGKISKIGKIVNTLDEMMKTEPNRKRIKERVTQDDMVIAMVQTVIRRFQLDDNQQTFLCTVPMFHIYGSVAFATGLIASGATVVVLSNSRSTRSYRRSDGMACHTCRWFH